MVVRRVSVFVSQCSLIHIQTVIEFDVDKVDFLKNRPFPSSSLLSTESSVFTRFQCQWKVSLCHRIRHAISRDMCLHQSSQNSTLHTCIPQVLVNLKKVR